MESTLNRILYNTTVLQIAVPVGIAIYIVAFVVHYHQFERMTGYLSRIQMAMDVERARAVPITAVAPSAPAPPTDPEPAV